ncbi:MAG: hypothetical protein VZR09_10385 [Candidatus Gastranaerophilaceae bacterium]|nr:hypothetical protein [Candidatus Gastranaerophilaceae bacterium]
MKRKFWAICSTIAFAFIVALNLSGCTSGSGTEDLTDSIPQQEVDIPVSDESQDQQQANSHEISIPDDADMDKMVSVSVDNVGRANPFMPPGEKPEMSESAKNAVASIPQQRLQYDVLPPLETPAKAVDENARRAATTRISGIMFDKNNPSAILNIDGLDYFVRSGDVLNGYKVLSISKSVVTVQVGSNVYKAGVGQLVEEGRNLVNYNTVANLSTKFGGNKK